MAEIKKALIIDDDEVNNFICVRQIRAASFAEEADFLLSGQEALDKLTSDAENDAENLPDIIFLDINMPMMSAWEFLQEYSPLSAKFPKEVKLFILSSSVYRKDQLRALDHDVVVDYLYKPLTKELLTKVKEKHFS